MQTTVAQENFVIYGMKMCTRQHRRYSHNDYSPASHNTCVKFLCVVLGRAPAGIIFFHGQIVFFNSVPAPGQHPRDHHQTQDEHAPCPTCRSFVLGPTSKRPGRADKRKKRNEKIANRLESFPELSRRSLLLYHEAWSTPAAPLVGAICIFHGELMMLNDSTSTPRRSWRS